MQHLSFLPISSLLHCLKNLESLQNSITCNRTKSRIVVFAETEQKNLDDKTSFSDSLGELHESVADSGFPRGGANGKAGGAKPIILTIVSQKLHVI